MTDVNLHPLHRESAFRRWTARTVLLAVTLASLVGSHVGQAPSTDPAQSTGDCDPVATHDWTAEEASTDTSTSGSIRASTSEGVRLARLEVLKALVMSTTDDCPNPSVERGRPLSLRSGMRPIALQYVRLQI